jgi:thiol:disulfide interchange protein
MKKIILALLLLGGFAACKSKTKAISANTIVPKERITWLNNTNLAQAKAEASGRPIFVDIGAVWCGYCKKMKKDVFTEDAVISAINAGFVTLSLDGEKGDGKALVSKLGIAGFPTQLILDAEGNVLKKNTGYMDTPKLLAFLK